MPEKLYEVLEVSEDATTAEIRRAYRRRVKESHPDVSDHPNAADRFQLVLVAKDVLTDPQERERYDDLGHDAYMDWFGEDDNGESTGSSRSGPKGPTERATDDAGSGATNTESTSEAGGSGGRTGGEDASSSTTGGADDRTRTGARSTGTGGIGTGSAGSSSSSAGDGGSSAGGSTGGSSSGGQGWTPSSPGGGSASEPTADAEDDADGESKADDEGAVEEEPEPEPEDDAETGAASAASAESDPEPSATRRRSARSAASGVSSAVDEGAVADAAERRRKQWQAAARSGSTGGGTATVGQHGDGLAASRIRSGIATKIRSRDAVVMTTVLLVAYPIFVFSTVWPDFPVAVKAFMAIVTVVVLVYTLTEPVVALVVFGVWSALTPLLLSGLPVEMLSPVGLFALSASWVPFLLSVLLTLAMPD